MSNIDFFYIINLLVVTPFAFAKLSFYNTPKREKEYRNKVIKYRMLVIAEIFIAVFWITLKIEGII